MSDLIDAYQWIILNNEKAILLKNFFEQYLSKINIAFIFDNEDYAWIKWNINITKDLVVWVMAKSNNFDEYTIFINHIKTFLIEIKMNIDSIISEWKYLEPSWYDEKSIMSHISEFFEIDNINSETTSQKDSQNDAQIINPIDDAVHKADTETVTNSSISRQIQWLATPDYYQIITTDLSEGSKTCSNDVEEDNKLLKVSISDVVDRIHNFTKAEQIQFFDLFCNILYYRAKYSNITKYNKWNKRSNSNILSKYIQKWNTSFVWLFNVKKKKLKIWKHLLKTFAVKLGRDISLLQEVLDVLWYTNVDLEAYIEESNDVSKKYSWFTELDRRELLTIESTFVWTFLNFTNIEQRYFFN